MLNFMRTFHVSAIRFMLPEHPLFRSLDWTRIEAGQYAVVDPVSTGAILYVSYQDYLVLVRVALSNNITLKVLAAPGEAKPSTQEPNGSTSSDPNSQNSPPLTDPATNDILMDFFFPKGTKKVAVSRRRGHTLRTLLTSPLIRFTDSETGEAGTLMVKLTNGNILQWLTMWHNRLHWWSRSTVPGIVTAAEVTSFAIYLKGLFLRHGINHLIQRFKISLFVVNAYLGGRRMTTTQDLGFRIRLSNGLPAFLPHRVRNGIRNGNRHYIHIWTSVLNSYKGLKGTWVEPRLDEGTIAQKPPVLETRLLYQFGIFCRLFWRLVKVRYRPSPLSFHVKQPFFTTKAGPNAPVSLLGAGLDAYLWYSLDKVMEYDPNVSPEHATNLAFYKHRAAALQIRTHLGVDSNLIRQWFEVTGQPKLLRMIKMTGKMFILQYNLSQLINKPWAELLKRNSVHPDLKKPQAGDKSSSSRRRLRAAYKETQNFWRDFMGANNALLRFTNPTLSRLHNLYEAAGKVRTIAIVDYWTNFALKPLHDWMFEILQNLPQDATFDQEGRVEEFAQRGYTHVYSYDLKSATDLIPLTLYKYLMGHIVPRGVLECWMQLLTNRSFRVPDSTVKTYPKHPRSIRYNTGQPMGALTSWALMALLHHVLVLFCAYRAGLVPLWKILDFVEYLVLGDDIVIANELVAEQYVLLMKQLHIPIGLAKSHISTLGMFNFANQTFVQAVNVSPISMKEDLNAKGLLARIALAMRMARRGWKDMRTESWLSSLLRAITNSTVWKKTLAPLAAVRGSVPFLHWIIASTLLPGTSRFCYAGLSVDPRLLLSTYVRKERVWTTRLEDLKNIVLPIAQQSLLSLFTANWADSIYQQFLANRIRLKDFDTWVTRVISVDIEWLFIRIFSEGRAKAQEDWASKYRIPVKEVQVSSKLPAVNTVGLLEIATGRSLDEVYQLLAEAEQALPLIPDFNNKTLSAIIPDNEGGVPARDAALKRSQLQAMLKVASLVVMLEQIPQAAKPGQESGPHNSSGPSLDAQLRAIERRTGRLV